MVPPGSLRGLRCLFDQAARETHALQMSGAIQVLLEAVGGCRNVGKEEEGRREQDRRNTRSDSVQTPGRVRSAT